LGDQPSQKYFWLGLTALNQSLKILQRIALVNNV
jgi:hypothetical protein